MTSQLDGPKVTAVALKDIADRYGQDPQRFLSTVLTADERAQFEHVCARRRLSWLAGRVAGKQALRASHGGGSWHQHRIDVDGIVPRPATGGALSLGHAGEFAVAAYVRHGRVGVDVEPLREFSPAAASSVFHPEELCHADGFDVAVHHRTLALWSLREAVVKAFGGRFSNGFGTVQLRQFHPGRVRVRIHGERVAEHDFRLRHHKLHHHHVSQHPAHLVTVVHADQEDRSPWN